MVPVASGAVVLWLGTSLATGGATVGSSRAGVDGSGWDPVRRSSLLGFLLAGAAVATGRQMEMLPGGGLLTIVCHSRFRQFLPAQQLEHSCCAALHLQTAPGSVPQVTNLVHLQHLRISAGLWRRRWQGLVESIDRYVDRRLQIVVSGLGPSSESRVE